MSNWLNSDFAREQIDRVAITDLIQRERVSRDMRLWPQMAACYAEDSLIDIAWFRGNGAQFAAASEGMVGNGLRTFHETGPSLIRVQGDRAIADTATIIHMIGEIDGIGVDIVSHARMYTRLVRRDGRWLLYGIRAAYLQDMIIPLDPTRVPQVQLGEVTDIPPTYRIMSYMLKRRGLPAWPEQPGMDRPATVHAALAREDAWLATGKDAQLARTR